MSTQLELFKHDFLWYHEGMVIVADFNSQGQLIVISQPFMDFQQVIIEICDGLPEMVFFEGRLDILIYPFGSNDGLTISVN